MAFGVGLVDARCPSARYRIAVTLGSGLGLRQGEVFGLAVEDVDFLRGVVEVRRQVKVFGGNRLVFGLPKGDKPRTVPLPESVATELSSHLAAYPRQSVTLPWGTPAADKRSSAGLLLTTRERSALNRNYFNTRLWKAAQRVSALSHPATTACTPCATGTRLCS
jgi:integrase